MSRRLLVVSTVHPPDDPRIREKLIRSLDAEWDITYATRIPGPSDDVGLTYKPLKAGRILRWFQALWEMLADEVNAVVFHDPELIPAGLIVSALQRKPVVFDLHENLPAQMLTKRTIPEPLRGPVSSAAKWWLSMADRFLGVTLAEAGYRDLFRGEHPVFPNYPDAGLLPPMRGATTGPVVYVGDVREDRGALTLVEAARGAGVPQVVFVGRCRPELAQRLTAAGDEGGTAVDVKGWLPYREAMAIAAGASVGVAPLHDEPNFRNSLPTKTLEYLALGVPVIASDLPGTREVIGGLPGVSLVPPGDSDALAAALSAVDADVQSDARGGVREVRRRFHWPGDEVRKYYASLLRGDPA